MASGVNPNLMGTLNLNKNDVNKEIHNRNLTIKEIYSIFGPLMVTHKLIELDDDFKKYLLLDGINLGTEEKKLISRDISDKIINEIKTYEYVFIKLNSKAPVDSEFLCLQLKCYSLDDILSLLKGSERLNKVFNPYSKNYLIIKPWYKIEHKNEFRCYLINKRLKGISQKYINLYEEYEDIDKIRDCIIEYIYSKEVKEALDKVEIDDMGLHYMIIDLVYMPKKNKVKIIDVETLIEGGNDIIIEEDNNTNINNNDLIDKKNSNVNLKKVYLLKMSSGINPNLMGTLNLNKNDTNKEVHNRNLSIKEIYSIFGPLMITYKLIEIDNDFKKYLMLDGISVGPEEKKLICRDISDQILSEIKTHDYVFIKFNSKAPTDSEFLCLQLKCYSLDDILALLKGSSRLNDVFNPYSKNYLIIKPWYKIEHKNEFRCYLINKRLKGISQKYINLYEEYDDIDKIRECIIEYMYSKEVKEALDKVVIDDM